MITLPLKNDNLRAESIKVIESKQTEVFDQRPLMCKYSFPFPSFRLFWTKNWSKKPRWNLTFCAKIWFEILSIFSPFFPYSNKSENLCNNFDFLKINKTKKIRKQKFGTFLQFAGHFDIHAPRGHKIYALKKIYFDRKTTFIV